MKMLHIGMILLLMAGSAVAGTISETEAANTTSLLVVFGEAWLPGGVWEQPSGSVIWVFNQGTGSTVPAEVGETQAGIYEAVFFNADHPVAAVGDTLKFLVSGGGGYHEGNGTHVLTADEISAGMVRYDVIPDFVSGSPFPGLVTVLQPPYPNPFNPAVSIRFELATGGPTRLTIHDLQGRLVAILLQSSLETGPHEVVWRGLDQVGHPVSSGVYLVSLKKGREDHFRRITLVR